MTDWITPWINTLSLMLLPIGLTVIVLWFVDTRCKSIPANYRSWMWRLFFAKCLIVATLPWCSGIPHFPSVPSHLDVVRLNAKSVKETPADTINYSSSHHSGLTPNVANIGDGGIPNTADATSRFWLPWFSSGNASKKVVTIIFLVWLACVLLQLTILSRNYRRMLAAMRRESQAAGSELLELYRSVAVRLDIRNPPRLRLSDHVSGPALLYCGAVKIVLPTKFHERFGNQACGMAIAHELAHFVRRDLFWNLISTVVSIAFFFYPPIWLALRRYRITMETACDTLAIRAAKVDRPTYARLLVDLLETASPRTSPIVLTMAQSDSFSSLTERLNAMKTSQSSRHSQMIAFGTLSVLTALLLAPWGTADEPSASANRPTKSKQSESSSIGGASASGSASAGGFARTGAGGFVGGSVRSSASATITDSNKGSSQDRYSKSGGTGSSNSISTSTIGGGFAGGSSNSNARSGSRSNQDAASSTIKTTDGDIRISKSTSSVDGNRISNTQVISKRETITILQSDDEGVEVRVIKRGQKSRDAKVYRADSMEEFATEHPAIYQSMKKYMDVESIATPTLIPSDNNPAKQMMREQLQNLLDEAKGNPQLEKMIRQMLEENQ